MGLPPRTSILLAKTQNILGPEILRLRVECGFKQRELVIKLQVGGWNLSAESLCKIEVGDRTLTDVELAFILRILKKEFSDLRFPTVVFPKFEKLAPPGAS